MNLSEVFSRIPVEIYIEIISIIHPFNPVNRPGILLKDPSENFLKNPHKNTTKDFSISSHKDISRNLPKDLFGNFFREPWKTFRMILRRTLKKKSQRYHGKNHRKNYWKKSLKELLGELLEVFSEKFLQKYLKKSSKECLVILERIPETRKKLRRILLKKSDCQAQSWKENFSGQPFQKLLVGKSVDLFQEFPEESLE